MEISEELSYELIDFLTRYTEGDEYETELEYRIAQSILERLREIAEGGRV